MTISEFARIVEEFKTKLHTADLELSREFTSEAALTHVRGLLETLKALTPPEPVPATPAPMTPNPTVQGTGEAAPP